MEIMDLYKNSVKRAFFHLWGLLIISFLAIKLKLYDIFWWFDRPMHFYGGYVAGLLIIALLFRNKISFSSKKFFFLLLLGAFLVGIAWEFFELFVENHTGADLVSMRDSIEDLICDMLGSFVAYFMYYIDKKESKISKI